MSEPSGVLSKEVLPASVAIFTTTALVAFEGLAVTAALPEIAADLGSVSLLPWVITAFILVSGIATALAGPFVDGLGSRVMFRWALGVFVISGTLAAFSPSMEVLVAARVVQGAGGGMISAVGLAAVGLVYPGRLISRAYAANATVWGVMGVAGPAIAAVMLTQLDWRWIFLINLPLGALALAAGWRVLPEAKGAGDLKVDGRGALLISGLTIGTVMAVDSLGIGSLGWMGGAALCLFLYLAHARRYRSPVVRIEHLFRQPYSGLALGIGLLVAGGLAAEAYLPLYVRGALGRGQGLTAWSVLFFTVGWTTGSNVGGRIVDRFSETSVTLSGFFFTVPALGGLAWAVAQEAHLAIVLAFVYLAGVGIGVSTNSALTLLRQVTSDSEMGRATAAHQFGRAQGFTIGVALGGSVILFTVASRVGDVEAVQQLLSGDADNIGTEVAQAIASGYSRAALAGMVAAMLGASVILQMKRFLASKE